MENYYKGSYFSVAIILAAGIVIASLILANTWGSVASRNVTITVTGSASKEIRSDLAEWSGTFSNESPTLTDAYARLKESNKKVKNYLTGKGFEEEKLKFSAITTTTLYATNTQGYKTEQVTGYRLSQRVSIESSDVDKIDKLSREATELINQGVEIDSYQPKFFYTKLGDLKVEMIGLASEDAKMRAEQIAKSTGDDIGEVRSSRTGVIQITAKNSTDVSDYGINDTSSLEKKITAVVSISFSID
jgi:hypothetical protein